MPSQSFADLGVSKPVVAALGARGFHSPFAVQKLVIADVLAGRDVLAQSPTGSGKTLAFGVPIADLLSAEARRPAALILAPTRELAGQIVDELAGRGQRPRALGGGRARRRRPPASGQARREVAHRGGHARPARGSPPARRPDAEARQILVLDEADRMLDMGFKPAVDRIVAKCPPERQTLFFSATLEGAAGQLAKAYTRDARKHVHKPREERKADVEHRFVHLTHDAKLGALVKELRDEDRGRTLVFVRTKRGADRLVKRLGGAEHHGAWRCTATRPSPSARRRSHASRSGAVDTLVATDVAARGIDVADDHPRDQLRRARGSRRLRAPRRPHGPRGRRRSRGQLRSRRPGARHAPHRRGPRPLVAVRRAPAARGRRRRTQARRNGAAAGTARSSGRRARASAAGRGAPRAPRRAEPARPELCRVTRDGVRRGRSTGSMSANGRPTQFWFAASTEEFTPSQMLEQARVRRRPASTASAPPTTSRPGSPRARPRRRGSTSARPGRSPPSRSAPASRR